jgi:hypothetical protein
MQVHEGTWQQYQYEQQNHLYWCPYLFVSLCSSTIELLSNNAYGCHTRLLRGRMQG